MEENIIKILVASDTHLGYKERDSTQEKDSFNSFEEIFQIAHEKDADFVLLGGDLFHDNKPSRKTLHSCMEIMRRYCLGSRPCQVEVISDQSIDFGHTSSTISTVNYENPNLNISMPVFSIHGNHDDPAGSGSLSAIDLLSVAGLLNHFGRARSLEKINISPVLLQKGSTKLALYGLGSIRDERLHRLFLSKNVNFLCPKEAANDWFNIMVIHQNRAQHGATNHIPEQFLPGFLDLVVWGHEHESIIPMDWNSVQNFHVLQPGSPVATSLSPGESKKKHVTFLEIRGKELRHEFIPLKTVRKMYIEDIILKNVDCISPPSCPTVEDEILDHCKEKVEILIERAQEEHTGHPKQPKIPLIRLRIDCTGGYPMFNAYRLAANFVDRVANAKSIIHFLRKQTKTMRTAKHDMSDLDDMIVDDTVEKVKVEDLVEEYLTSEDKKYKLSLLSAKGMSMAVREFVDKYERDAIFDLCGHQLKKMHEHLKQSKSEYGVSDDIIEEINNFKQVRNQAKNSTANSLDAEYENEENISAILEKVKQSRSASGISAPTAISDDEENAIARISDEEQQAPTTSKRGRGSRGTRGKSSGRGRGSRGGKATKAAIPVETTSTRRKSSRKQENIMDAFSAASQRSRPDITEIADSGDEEIYVSRVSGRRSVAKRERDNEEDNPFVANTTRKKRR